MTRNAGITETIGDTTLARPDKLASEGVDASVQVESFNPLRSVKQRMAIVITEAASVDPYSLSPQWIHPRKSS